MNIKSPTQAADAVDHFAQRAAIKAEDTLQSTRQVANDAIDAMQNTVNDLRDAAPSTLTRAAAQVDELTRRSLERARDAGARAQRQLDQLGAKSTEYIRDEPMKSVLIAAATGAVVAGLLGWMARSRSSQRG